MKLAEPQKALLFFGFGSGVKVLNEAAYLICQKIASLHEPILIEAFSDPIREAPPTPQELPKIAGVDGRQRLLFFFDKAIKKSFAQSFREGRCSDCF